MGWLRQLFSRRRRYDELSESIREHLEEKIADLMDHGMTREQAERAARREFGNVTRIEERSREVWQWPTLESIWADVRYASAAIRQESGFYWRRFIDARAGDWSQHGHFHVVECSAAQIAACAPS